MSANESAIGLAADALETPALVLDLDAYRRNVRRMAEYITGRHGLHWRPHMKGQKAPPLALEAVKAGAIGVTCATLYEAEAMAAAGVASILIANQIVGERKLDRLARLAQRTPGVIAATDSLTHARMLAAAVARAGGALQVLIEVNVGMNRCGIAPGEATVELAGEIHTALPSLRLAGLMGWEGHVLSFDDPTKQARIDEAMTALTSSAGACRAAGIPIGIVSSSGSGTFRMAAPLPGITEVQAGGGVFSDLNYQKWGLTEHEFALTVLTRVVSRPATDRVIVDGGFKTMSVQHGLPKPQGLAIKNLALSAEHGTLELAESSPEQPAIGSLVSFIPGYTDSTVCLHDEMCVVEGGRLVAVWPIPGRTGRREWAS
ncbi:MAG: DSD1 family PLP-dependent enzyme [Acidobacteria bacterium]|nr:DSD1 family PLP-dependent enzyme [Acidobacteriota bacterium]